MGTQHYSLRWNNHQSHVLSAFDALLQNESLVDCTLVCEDTSVRAHKVVLSACSPYFQKIFTDNPCKHPIIVLKDIRGWEVQCIVDFMYKGETSVPESQLTGLIKAAESLKVRGLTSTDQHLPPRPPPAASRHSSPMPPQGVNGYHCRAGYSPSPARYPPAQHHEEPQHNKLAHLAAAAVSNNGPHSNQSSPMSLTSHDNDRHRAPSPGQGSGPRRKQARPRRRSGDSTGNASLDLSKSDSPPLGGFRKSPAQFDDATPENLSMKRPSSSPAMNLVKTETLLEDGRTVLSDNISDSSSDRECKPPPPPPQQQPPQPPQHPQPSQMDTFAALSREHLLHGNGLHHVREHEALQALNFMAAGGGLPAFPPGHPLAHPNGSPHLAPSPLAGLAGAGRPTSTPTTPTNAFAGDAADFLMLLSAGSGNLKAGGLSLNPIHRRRRSLSQSQLLDLGGKAHHHHHLHHLNSHHQGLFGKVPANIGLFDNPVGSNQPSHGTSAGFCNICKKLVSNRTNHKYVHSQVKFRCKLCGYLYSRKDTLKDHIRGKHNPRYSTSDLNSLVEIVPPAPTSPNLVGTSSPQSPSLVGTSSPKSPNLVGTSSPSLVVTPPGVPSALTTIADALMKSSHEAAKAENISA